jgi:phosphatidylethanolamine/phosphatidyl-N-methylethanolamine N-methyltransferase
MRIFDTNIWHRVVYTLGAPVYNILTRGFRKRRRRSIEAAGIEPGERVLLVGAGTGLDLDFIPHEARITAIDITPAMLLRLRRRARRLGLAVDARVMDGRAMEFPDGAFDVVILHLILSVIPDPVRCATEVGRVLRRCGRAVILDKFVPDEGKPPLLNRIMNPVAAFFGTRLDRSLGPLVAAAGLRIVCQKNVMMAGLFKITLAQKD